MLSITNKVFKTKLKRKINLAKVHALLPNSKLYRGRPTQLLVKDKQITILLFPSGSIIVMGKIDEQFDAIMALYALLPAFTKELPNLYL